MERNLLVEIANRDEIAPHRILTHASTLEQLKEDVWRDFFAEEEGYLELSVWDSDFQEFVFVDTINQIQDKTKVKVYMKTVTVNRQLSSSSTGLSPNQDEDQVLDDMYMKMKDPLEGLKLKTRSIRLKTYQNCISGSKFVDWIQDKQKVDRQKAVQYGQMFFREHYIHHITYSSPFEDRDTYYYQLQELGDMRRKSTIPKFDCDEVMLGLLSSSNGVPMRVHKDRLGLRKYPDCFLGTDAVDWLSANLNIRRNVAISVGNKLMRHGFFRQASGQFPFLDAPLIYTTLGGKRPNYDFPAERIIRLLQQLKTEEAFQQNSEIDYVISALGRGSGTLFNVGVEELLANSKADRETSSLVLSHTGSGDQNNGPLMSRPATPKPRSHIRAPYIPIALSDPIVSLLETNCDWNFEIFKLYDLAKEKTMPILAMAIFRKHDLIERFDIDEQRFMNFFSALQRGYMSNNPYHNAIHACDVMQTVNYFLTKGGFGQVLEPVEILAALIAGAAHDVGHPGLNNAFLINSRDKLSVLYNDQSVLENHHTATAFDILLQEQNNFLLNVDKTTYMTFRRLMIKMILATDFGKHFDYLGQFKSTTATPDVDFSKQDIKELFLEIAVKCADISHTAKKLPMHLEWTNRVTEEFYHQGDEEKRLGMNVSPLMDRITGNVAKSQIGFINFMSLPIYECWTEEFENTKEAVQQVEANLEYWKNEVDKQNGVVSPPKKVEEEKKEEPKTDGKDVFFKLNSS
eukprot:TRINITY_DN1144_c0_g1_i3.p1 TRINITY_DN1144_c0_g1~~TRINITY_DN1144_c0_g1_i3.p1  ORF type:complete len:742 (-),score=223.09 TRINITY_DN1144_c0_g1_i3:206-2431(-)